MTTPAILPRDSYVYVHRRATTKEIFYVGKGTHDRAWDQDHRNGHWYNTVAKHGLIVEILQDGLQDWAALELECDLIALHGRKDLGLGSLVNWTDGGEGLSNPSDEVRTRMSKATKRQMADPEARARLSEIAKRRMEDPKQRARMTEMSRLASAPEARARNSEATKRRMADPEVRARHSEGLQRRFASHEARARLSEARKRTFADPEVRARMSEAIKRGWADPRARAQASERAKRNITGRVWVNNGVLSAMVYPHLIPEGFVRGRLTR